MAAIFRPVCRFALAVCCAWGHWACSDQLPEELAADTSVRTQNGAVGARVFDAGEIKSVEAYLAEPEFAAADLQRGELLSLSCAACHSLAVGESHQLGPNLFGIFGQQAAGRDGFEYSEALRASGLYWTPGALDAWLAEPAEFVPGSNMAFSGFRSPSDRRDLIAYLMLATSGRSGE